MDGYKRDVLRMMWPVYQCPICETNFTNVELGANFTDDDVIIDTMNEICADSVGYINQSKDHDYPDIIEISATQAHFCDDGSIGNALFVGFSPTTQIKNSK